jgi:hypothetical protein
MLFCPQLKGNIFNSAWAQKTCPPYRADRAILVGFLILKPTYFAFSLGKTKF